MSPHSFTVKSWNGRYLKIRRVTPEERARIIRDAVAKEVHQNCESRGCEPGHELKDWRQAESEILRPLNCGFLMLDDNIELSTDGANLWRGRNRDLRRAPASHDLRNGAHRNSGSSLELCRTFDYPLT